MKGRAHPDDIRAKSVSGSERCVQSAHPELGHDLPPCADLADGGAALTIESRHANQTLHRDRESIGVIIPKSSLWEIHRRWARRLLGRRFHCVGDRALRTSQSEGVVDLRVS